MKCRARMRFSLFSRKPQELVVSLCISATFQDPTNVVHLSCCSVFTWVDSAAWQWRVWGGPVSSQWLSWDTGFHHSAPKFLQTAWARSRRPSSWSDPSPPGSAHTSPCRLSLGDGQIRTGIYLGCGLLVRRRKTSTSKLCGEQKEKHFWFFTYFYFLLLFSDLWMFIVKYSICFNLGLQQYEFSITWDEGIISRFKGSQAKRVRSYHIINSKRTFSSIRTKKQGINRNFFSETLSL